MECRNLNKYISFIVPVYNVESYLEQCIESLLNQDVLKNSYEILLVDDGSTDLSGKICKKFSMQYPNIMYFHKKNGGLSEARNYGVQRATGKYILFVDSDDYIQKNVLGTIIKQCRLQGEPEVFFLQAKKVFPNGNIKKYDKKMKWRALQSSHQNVIHYLADRDMYPASACLKMVNREFLIEYGIYFKVGQLSEDYEWSWSVIINASTYGCCNRDYYYYRQKRKGSITNEVSEKRISDLFSIIHNMELAAQQEKYKSVSEDILKFASYIYRCLLCDVSPFYKKYENQLEHDRHLLNKKNSKDIIIIRNISKVIGLKNTIKLLEIYKMFR